MANMSQLPISIGPDKEGNFTHAMQLLSSSVLPFVLHSTIELNVFEILAKASDTQLSSSQIVAKMDCNNPIDAANMLVRMLYLLATYSLLTCSINNNNNNVRLYGLSPVGKMFVSDNEDGASLRPLLDLLQQKVVINTWFGLKDAVLEGGVPFERIHGVNTFEYFKTDHIYNDVFNKAMFNHTTLMMKNILDKYKGFENIKTLVDVGGGLGSNLKMITTKYPTIKGTNFDHMCVLDHWAAYLCFAKLIGEALTAPFITFLIVLL
ncbi:caffeic acid 3-O-methyltransferase-like [Solanum stenotomum]|uniref:caffeic acid 3-O-methyltransferase-like n=1 Tax=Solanum stenotomum TaxID=172797 RepID=UPI0020D0E328|nr:caffeic acid 3-O-methyltransferase-like [Solanum stenotomum]